MPSPISELGELQLAILNVLWSLENATVHDVLSALPADRSPAYTTVLTVLRTLEKRGVVTHNQADGARSFHYSPLITRQQACADAVRDLLDRLFEGSPALLVRHIVESHPLSPSEQRELKTLLGERPKPTTGTLAL